MGILLGILSVIGKILLGVLLLILILLAVLLFVPIRYGFRMSKDQDEIHLEGTVSWLLRFIAVSIKVDRTQGSFQKKFGFRLCGVSPSEVKAAIKKRNQEKRQRQKKRQLEAIKKDDPARYEELKKEARERKAKREAAKRETEQQEPQRKEDAKREAGSQEASKTNDQQSHAAAKKAEKQEKQKITDHELDAGISDIPDNSVQKKNPAEWISDKTESLKKAVSKADDSVKFLKSDELKNAVRSIRKLLIRLLRHICPKRLKGRIHYGFDDPSKTGEVLGAVSIMKCRFGGDMEIIPDFENKVIEGSAVLHGRIFIYYLLYAAAAALISKDVRYLIRKVRKKPDKEEADNG